MYCVKVFCTVSASGSVGVLEYFKLADCTTVEECKQQVESEMCVYVFMSVGRVILDTYMWYTSHLHCIVHSLR